MVNAIPTSRAYHTEIDGGYYEEEADACMCGGDYEEGYECERCGEYEAESVLINGWCRSCVAFLCEANGLKRKRDYDRIYDLIAEGAEI